MASCLTSTVPPLEAEQFLTTSVIFEMIRSDGKLAPLPAALTDKSAQSPLEQAKRLFGAAWIDVLNRVMAGEMVSRNDIHRLQEALVNWKTDAAKVLADDTLMARIHAKRYFDEKRPCRWLSTSCRIPKRCEQLRQFLASGGAAFAGGTLGELAEHVLANRLAVRPGSPAQDYLARLVGLSEGLNAQIAACDRRMAEAATDSPAREAAVKQRLANDGRPSSEQAVGVPSTVSRWYSSTWTYTGARSSTRTYTVPHVIRIPVSR